MKTADIISLLILLTSIGYFTYLLDPFNSKPHKRIYKRLLTDPKFYGKNLVIAILFMLMGVTSILFRGDGRGSEAFTLSPFFFLILIRCINGYSKKYQNRDLYLLERGDVLKASLFDTVSSIALLALSWGFSVVVLIIIQHVKG